MKKFLLLSLLAIFATTTTQAKIIATKIHPGTGELTIKNVAGSPYNYSNFVLSIGTSFFILNSLNIVSGNLNAATDEEIKFSGLVMPRSAGTSIAIWYPGTNSTNAGAGSIIDFFQYGAAGHPYESAAVAAVPSIWTAGEFVAGSGPFERTSEDHGAGEWQVSSGFEDAGINAVTAAYPNPFTDHLTIAVPETYTGDGFDIQIFDVRGSVVYALEGVKQQEIVLEEELENGIYFLSITYANGKSEVRKLVKAQ